MPEQITILFQLFANAAVIIALIITGLALWENIKTRKTSVRPLLFPGRVSTFISDDNLFACNFEYPISDDIGIPKLVYFGIKNIGKGPANNVKVITFQSEDEKPDIFRAGSNIVRIPEDGIIPYVIRISRKEDGEYSFVTYYTTIYYEDIFGGEFYLSVRLFIRDPKAIVIEYNDEKKPKWKEFGNVVWREIESNGFFEMRKLEDELFKSEKFEKR